MSTSYPGIKQTFSDPSGTSSLATGPDHAALHTDINDTLEAVQDVIGTTAGTSVLKDFGAGQFPVRMNSGGTIVQTLTGGTLNNSVIGTTQFTGGTISNSVLGTPTINLGSDNTGDLFYRSSGGTLTKLSIGTSGQVLTTNGTTPSWGSPGALSSKIITSSRDLTAASGNVSYTGVGFRPTSIIVIVAISSVTSGQWSIGAIDSGGGTGYSIFSNNSANNSTVARLINIQTGNGPDVQDATLVSFDSDGFTLAWTKAGSPTGTVNLIFICFK